MEYTHLYISQNFDYNFIPGAEVCFSKIEFLKFNNRLKLYIYGPDYNDGIVKLIENQKKLFNISFLDIDKSFVNLKILELKGNNTNKEWYNIRDLQYFLPSLQTLNATDIPIACYNGILIRAVYHNCPNIMYLELLYKNENILDLEKLLNNCQYPKRLSLYCYYRANLFCQPEIPVGYFIRNLAGSSPPGLFEFNFKSTDNKPGNYRKVINDELIDLVERYKEKGVIKNYVYYSNYFNREYTNILDKYIVEKIKLPYNDNNSRLLIFIIN
ncbi:hypothetical protein RhiirA4_473967 [Rhizophagus irregularis]|uniref:Uncharacterized protein n=1 Tax=Rhizophagus irregularis TaxID=588596 RepID=A0A2I1H7R6_9GLOM|nr:hypothetical protein RhiirA4_473967 [Rhizophagus irregularis]